MSDLNNSPKSSTLLLVKSTKSEAKPLGENDSDQSAKSHKKSKSKSKSISKSPKKSRFSSPYQPKPKTMVSLADYMKPGTILDDDNEFKKNEEDQWTPLTYFNPMNAPIFYNGNEGAATVGGYAQPNMFVPVAPINLPQLPLQLPPAGLPRPPPWIYTEYFRPPTEIGFVNPAAPPFIPQLPPPPSMPMSPPGLSPSGMSACETMYSPMTPQMSHAPEATAPLDLGISLDECEFMENFAIGYTPSPMLPLLAPKFADLLVPNTDPLNTLKTQTPSSSLKTDMNNIQAMHSRKSSSSSTSAITATTIESNRADSSYFSDSSAAISMRKDSFAAESSSALATPTQTTPPAWCWLSTAISGDDVTKGSIGAGETKASGPKRAPPGLPIPEQLRGTYRHFDELPPSNSPSIYGPIKPPRLPLRWRRKSKTKIEYELGSKCLIDPEDPCIKPLDEMRWLPLPPSLSFENDIISLECAQKNRRHVVSVPLFQGAGFDYIVTHPPRKGRTWTCCKCFQIHDFADGNVCPKDVHAFCDGCLAYVEQGREEEFGSWKDGYYRGEEEDNNSIETITPASPPPTTTPIDDIVTTSVAEAMIAKKAPKIMKKSKSVVDIKSLVQQIINTEQVYPTTSTEKSTEEAVQSSPLDIHRPCETAYQACASPQSSSFDERDEVFSSAPASFAGSANTSPPSSDISESVRRVLPPLRHVLKSKLSDFDLFTENTDDDDGEAADESEGEEQDLQFGFDDGFTVRRRTRSFSYDGSEAGRENNSGERVELLCKYDTQPSTPMIPTCPVTDREGLRRLVKNLVEMHRWRSCGMA